MNPWWKLLGLLGNIMISGTFALCVFPEGAWKTRSIDIIITAIITMLVLNTLDDIRDKLNER